MPGALRSKRNNDPVQASVVRLHQNRGREVEMSGRAAIGAVFTMLAIMPALAQAPPVGTPTRIRGVVEKLDGQALQVKSREGALLTIALAPNYTCSGIAKRSLADIKTGDYVGAASLKSADGKLIALEVLIFPEAMKGTGEGHRAWDPEAQRLMTNATVAGIASAADGQALTLKHKDGETEVIVPAGVPVVTFVPADPSLLKPGAAVFIGAQKQPDGSLTAARVTAE